MIEKIKENKKYYILLFAIFFVNLFLRLYKLDSLPYAIHIDEAGLWYNVKNLLKYGCDQGGYSWPLLLSNFYGEQSAMYTYLTLICVKLFGDTLFALRIPAVLNGCMLFIFGNKTISKVYDNKKINILFSVLITLSPYFILSQKSALDCNLMLGFSTMFLYFFIKAIVDKKTIDAIIAGITGGLALYTYAVSYIVFPIFLIISIIILLIKKEITMKQILAFSIPLCLLAIPLVVIQVINVFDLNQIQIGSITLTKFIYSRHSDISLSFSIAGFFKPILFTFFPSHTHTLSTELVLFGNISWIFLPFFIIGIFLNIKKIFSSKYDFKEKVLPLFWLSIYITSFFMQEILNTWKINSSLGISLLFIVEGFCFICDVIKNKKIKNIFIVLIATCFLMSSIGFFSYYYGEYADDEANSYGYMSEKNLTDALEFAQSISKNNNIYVVGSSIVYRIYHDIDYNNPKSVYTGMTENLIQIDGYYFDEGLSSINDDSYINNIYITHHNAESKITILEDLNFKQTRIGSYIVHYYE